MQHKQFTNPHYQKILEKVIKHRHPELSFEEGLEIEVTLEDCLICLDDFKQNLFIKRMSDWRALGYPGKYLQDEILGRPITICELANVLFENDVITDCDILNGWFLLTNGEKLEFDNSTYHLHEQPIEVQEKIANLF